MSYYALISLLILQRLQEMRLGKENLQKIAGEKLLPLSGTEKKLMLLLHSGFFISCIVEYQLSGQLIQLSWFIPGLLILTLCQLIRFRTMGLLGEYWTPYPLAFRNQKVVTEGPYRYVRHPNYLVVMIEILIVPLLGQCFFTAIIFSLLNFIFLRYRIQLEERALSMLPEYQKVFHMKKKLIPFIYGLLLMLNAEAGTIVLDSKTYDEAKAAPTWFLFTGESKKLGLIKSSFDGYAKKGSLTFSEGQGSIDNVLLTIEAASMDTDISARDNKLREESLSTEKYPAITIKISSIKTSEASQEVPAEMAVRGKVLPIKVTINKTDSSTYEGSSSFRLSEAGIPDPGIAIASVNDEFKIKFRVKLNP